MELRYQRDLYRVQLCCDTKKEEKELGYPLQMCLRNTLRGLLPCQIQGEGGQTSVCWDVTSRHSITQMVGDGQLETAVLKKILEALRNTMEELERYLIPCEYLVMDPDCMFLTADTGEIGFLCDFEHMQSFRETLPVLGEYVLSHMDHRDTEAMRLGYGLYRLTVEETFDKAALDRLCETAQPEEDIRTEQERISYMADTDGASQQQPQVQQRRIGRKHDTNAQIEEQRKNILEDFFSEDEDEEETREKMPFQNIILCGFAILAGLLLMEGIVFFRNGCHIQAGWIIAGVVIFAVSACVMAVLQWVSMRKKRADTVCVENISEKNQPFAALKDAGNSKKKVLMQKPVCRENYGSCEREGEQKAGAPVKSRGDTFNSVPLCETYGSLGQKTETNSASGNMETVMLGQLMKTEPEATLVFSDGAKYPLRGRHWLIGKSREAEICLQKPTVSRLHACLLKKEEIYYIEDLNSKNGTYIDAVALEPGRLYPLKSGQKLCFADQCCTFQQNESQDVLLPGI